MTTGIYKILNKTTGKFYIGSAIKIEIRWNRHKHDLRCNQHQNIHLQRAWNKYWEQSFEFLILEICDIDKLIITEQKWLDWTRCYDIKIGYNLTPTAGNSKGVKHSEETRKRMSEAKKKMSEKTKEKMRLARIGKKHTEEHKANISAGNKGRIVSQETKNKIANANKGIKRSEEYMTNMSARMTGKKRGRYKTKIERFLENNPPII